jgi:hypothetical protein
MDFVPTGGHGARRDENHIDSTPPQAGDLSDNVGHTLYVKRSIVARQYIAPHLDGDSFKDMLRHGPVFLCEGTGYIWFIEGGRGKLEIFFGGSLALRALP